MATTRNTERPLSARSVVASTLLGMRPPRLPTQILVRSGALFGIAEGTTRVALSRMVAAGELERRRRRLPARRTAARPPGPPGPLPPRRRRPVGRHAGPMRRASWADARDAQDRARLRAPPTALRLAELREGVWTRPANLPAGVLPDDEAVVADQCRGVRRRARRRPRRASPPSSGTSTGGRHRATELRRRLGAVVGALTDGRPRRPARGLRAVRGDPAPLPGRPAPPRPTASPRGWPGAALRADYDEYDAAFKTVWRAWYRDQVRAIGGGVRSARP